MIDTQLWCPCEHLQHLGRECAPFFTCACETGVRCHVPGSSGFKRVTASATQSTDNPFPSPHQTPPITSLRHLPSLCIHGFLRLQARDWLLMNKWRRYQSADASTTKSVSQYKRKHQSTTGTETSFKQSATAVQPWGRLTYWISPTAWCLWYDCHNTSYLLVIKCIHLQLLLIITAKKKGSI